MKYYSIPEVAKMLGISRIAVYKRVKSGKLKAIRTGRNYGIPETSLKKVMTQPLDANTKARIKSGVKRVISEYGETLKLLGKE